MIGTIKRGRFAAGAAALATLAAAFVLVAANASVASASPDFRQYVTVKFEPHADAGDRAAARRSVDARYEVALSGARLQQITVPAGSSPVEAADQLSADPRVQYAVASGTWRADDTPYFGDPYYLKQWALSNTGQSFMSRFVVDHFEEVSGLPGADVAAPAAWSLLDTGALASETIGVVDTGVAYQHSDLAANMVQGNDFFEGDTDPRDLNGHGTHVASIAAGVGGNDVGTVGVDPWAKVMPLRAADQFGNFSWAAIEQAVAFGLANGVRVFNGSFGGSEDDPAFEELMRVNPQALFVFSSGNGGSDGVGDNHDVGAGSHRYPCDSGLPNVICVGASDWNDQLASYSDYGVNSVDLLAPGSGVYAARPCITPASGPDDQGECPYDADQPNAPVGLAGGPYAFQLLSGTSMAAPAVAGAAALLWSKCPAVKSSQIKRALLTTVDPIATISSKVAYGGRLDLENAALSLAPCPAASDGADWPQPPPQPEGPGPDTGGGGPTPVTPTPPVIPPVTPLPSALRYQVVKPAKARVSRSRTVTFKLTCSAVCSAAVTARPTAHGLTFKNSRQTVTLKKASTVTVRMKLSKSAAKNVRALLAARTRVTMKVSLVVSDANGVAGKTARFNIRLAR